MIKGNSEIGKEETKNEIFSYGLCDSINTYFDRAVGTC